MIDSAETVLPEPDSPTSATISPLATLKEAWLTASTEIGPAANRTERSRTSTRGARAFMRASLVGLARVERVAHALTDKDQQAQQPGDGDEGGEPQPGRLQVGLALGQELAQRR